MIPLDRVRELLAALRPRALESLAREEPDWNDLCSYLGCAELFVAAPDLARQVLSLADALTTAERERDEAREIAVALGEVTEWQGRMLARAPTFEDAMALCIEAIVSTAADAPNCAEWRGTMGGREFVLSLQWADGKSPHALLSEARAERDTARSALDALLRGAPCGYVEARVVREYLDAVDASRRITGESYDALSEAAVDDWRNRYDEANAAKRAARTALDAALLAATTTPKESL